MNYFITAIVTLIVGYILWQLKKERISLNYYLTESDVFPRDTGVGKYFIIKLRNSGNKAIQNIALNIVFDSDVIETVSFSDKQLITDIEQNKSNLKGNLALLNPKEVLSTTITATSNKHIGTPNIFARALGATATILEDGSNNQTIPLPLAITILTTLAITLGTVAFTFFHSYNPEPTEQVESIIKKHDELIRKKEQGEPESAQFLFSIFNRSGISYLFPELIEQNGEIKYWKTGAYLMHRFLKDKRNRGKYVAAMLMLIEVENIAPSSLGFNLYLIAKMEEHRGNADLALKYLEKCKKKAPLMYDFMMAQDPSYDTKAMEDYFIKDKEKVQN